jgi:protein ImuB
VGQGGLRLTAVDAQAHALGLRPGEPLARARARIGTGIAVYPADPEADADALERLCVWARRYTPTVAPFGTAEGGDGLFLDIAGASHLFGGEAGLMADLAERLSRNALPARLALADTPGCAFALARHGGARNAPPIVPPGRNARVLRDLPVTALRLEPGIPEALRRLGLRRIGALADAPRAPLARRFGPGLLLRLDQALGHRPEPLIPLEEARSFSATRGFLDPIGHQDAIVTVVRDLVRELAPRLEMAGLGARGLRLTLHRVDGHASALDLGLSEPTRCAIQVGRLVDLRLDRLGRALDAGFGFETLRLNVTSTGPMRAIQATLVEGAQGGQGIGRLADALSQRLGRRLGRPEFRESHIPERASGTRRWMPPDRAHPALGRAKAPPCRPLILLRAGEAAQEVFSLAPDGPPQRFRWRRRLHRVAHAEGPERIAGEWWREDAPIRDYYRVEDEAGRRLWLYREGFHSANAAARWFVHGLFA